MYHLCHQKEDEYLSKPAFNNLAVLLLKKKIQVLLWLVFSNADLTEKCSELYEIKKNKKSTYNWLCLCF